MTTTFRRAALALAVAALAAPAFTAVPALAQGAPAAPMAGHTPAAKAGSVTVSQAWSRATAPQAANGATFLTLTNEGAAADRLLSAASPVAGKVELHTHIHDNGVMKMRPVEGIDVPAGGSTLLKPGGLHVMLLGLAQPLKTGDHFPLTLRFEKGGETTIEVAVQSAGAMGAPMH